jgi:hypothetical protein
MVTSELDVTVSLCRQGQPVDEDAIAEGLVRLVHETRCGNCMIWAKSDKVCGGIGARTKSPDCQGRAILQPSTPK